MRWVIGRNRPNADPRQRPITKTSKARAKIQLAEGFIACVKYYTPKSAPDVTYNDRSKLMVFIGVIKIIIAVDIWFSAAKEPNVLSSVSSRGRRS